MNAKHLFLTITLLFASLTMVWGTTKTDVINYTNVSAKITKDQKANSLSDCSFTSDASYSGVLWGSTLLSKIGLYNGRTFASTTSGGILTSVTVNFHSGATSGNTVTLFVGTTAYAGSETRATANTMSATSVDIVYDGSTSSVTYSSFAADYEYIALMGNTTVYIESIEIEWTVEANYTITKGSITGTGSGEWDTDVFVDKTTAKAGDVVTITFEPTDLFSSVTSYSYDDMDFDLSCIGYIDEGETYTASFIMPERNVTITAVFDEVEREDITITPSTYSITVESGLQEEITFERTLFGSSTPVTVGEFYYTIVNSSIADIELTDNGDGTGSCSISGLQVGTTTLLIQSHKIDNYAEGSSLPVTITVQAREVALVAQYSGGYYVMKNSLVDNMADAVQVYYDAVGDLFYYGNSENIDDFTWNEATPAKNKYTIQNPNNSNKYLTYGDYLLSEESSSYLWGKNAYKKFTNSDKWGIVYDGTNFLADNTMENAAAEALIANFRPLSYSTVSGAGIVDARTLAPEDWGTICVPFNVSAASVATSGAKFYTLTGKHVESETLVGVYISDPVTELVAGHSYFYQMEDGKTSISLTGASSFVTNAVNSGDGLIGCLTGDVDGTGKLVIPAGQPNGDNTDKPNGCYGLSKGKLRYVSAGSTGTIKPYRAYIDASELEEPAPAPGIIRRMIMNADYQGSFDPGVATSIVEVSDVMFIDWNQPVYNIMGMQVGKGATGVLIQNGQKFLVQ